MKLSPAIHPKIENTPRKARKRILLYKTMTDPEPVKKIENLNKDNSKNDCI